MYVLSFGRFWNEWNIENKFIPEILKYFLNFQVVLQVNQVIVIYYITYIIVIYIVI